MKKMYIYSITDVLPIYDINFYSYEHNQRILVILKKKESNLKFLKTPFLYFNPKTK